MQSTVEKLSSNKIKLRLELDAAAFEEALQTAYLKLRGRFSVPGFRKGKAPRKLIERLYGESVLYEEAFDAVFPGLYDGAVAEHGLSPVDQPEIDIETIGGGKNLVVSAEVYVTPEVTLGEYKGLAVARPSDEVDQEAVDQVIAQARERNAREEEVEGRPVQDDDLVTLDYEGTVDGDAFEGGTANGQTLRIGSGEFIPGFEEQLVGMEIGQEKDIAVTFPKEYHTEALAGKDAVFHVKVLAIRTRELPDLDDEFAKDVSEFDTFDAYRDSVRANLQAEATQRADTAFEDALVEAAVANAVVDVPPPLIERQIDSQLRDMAMDLAYRGLRMEDYLTYTGQTVEALRDTHRSSAERRVKGRLVVEAIRRAEDIQATQAEIDELIDRYAKGSGKDPAEYREGLTDQQTEYIAQDAATMATLSLLKKEAKP